MSEPRGAEPSTADHPAAGGPDSHGQDPRGPGSDGPTPNGAKPDAPIPPAPESPAPPEEPDLAFEPARRSAFAWSLLGIVTALSVVTDLWSKAWAFGTVAGVPVTIDRAAVLSSDRLSDLIPPHDPQVIVPSLLELTLVLNPGAVFGAGAGKRWVFIVFTVFAAAFAVWLFGWWTAKRDRWAHVGFGLLIGGGIGNLYDRLMYACVRDFLHPLPGVRLPFGITWPGGSNEIWPYVSNVADAQLLVGIALLLVYFWRADRHPERHDHAEAVNE